MLGQDDGDAQIVDQAGDRGEHILGAGRVESRGRLVQDQDPRVGGHRGAYRDALLLPAGQGVQCPVAQVSQAQQVEGLLQPGPHRRWLDGELLHRVRELFLHCVGDEPGQRVLPHDADHLGQFPGPCVAVSRPPTVTRPLSVPPVKCGTRPLMAPSRVDLPLPVCPMTRHSSPSSTRA